MNRKEEFLNNCIVLDAETTSLSFSEAEVIELGYALRSDCDWTTMSELYQPHEAISPMVSSITNITSGMVLNKPFFKDCVSQMVAIIGAFGGAGICVAHNAFYDRSVLERYGVNHPVWLCTMRIAKRLFGNDETVSNFKLPYLRYRFNILDPAYHDIRAHRADSDALVTACLLAYFVHIMEERNILDQAQPYAEQIRNWMEEPIIFETMPFGKHKGKRLADVPMDYWKWALRNMDSLDESQDNYDKDFAASVAIALDNRL